LKVPVRTAREGWFLKEAEQRPFFIARIAKQNLKKIK
jgi:hypothetical protein